MTSTPGDDQPSSAEQPGQPPVDPSGSTEPTQPLSGWAASPQPPTAPSYGGQPAGQPPVGPPPGWYPGPSPYRLPDHPDSTKALVLGIISLVGGFTCYLPMLLGPWAWVTGRRAVAEIDSQPGRWEGRSQAMAGYVMGIVATVLLILGVLALVGFIAFIALVSFSGPGSSSGAEF